MLCQSRRGSSLPVDVNNDANMRGRGPPIGQIALVLRYSRMNNPGSHKHWFAVPARENGAIYGTIR